MATNKDQLLKLIDFVQEVSLKPGNEWFKSKLIGTLLDGSLTHKNSDQSSLIALNTNVESIQRYLLLDVVPIIDYSDIEDEPIRNQLYRDCLEMLKYRLGKINNHINFDEFCRYAHLQAEELINYFFYKLNDGDITKISKTVKSYNPRYNPSKAPSNLGHIDYSIKLTALKKLSKLDSKTKYKLDFLNQIRNEISHRNSLQIIDEDQILCDFEREGFTSSGYVDLFSLSDIQKNIYFKGKFIINKRLQDYNSVYEALTLLKQNVVNFLTSQAAKNSLHN